MQIETDGRIFFKLIMLVHIACHLLFNAIVLQIRVSKKVRCSDPIYVSNCCSDKKKDSKGTTYRCLFYVNLIFTCFLAPISFLWLLTKIECFRLLSHPRSFCYSCLFILQHQGSISLANTLSELLLRKTIYIY